MSLDQHEAILHAFKKGGVVGMEERDLSPEHIRTFISDVFLFPATVYKVCRRDNSVFNRGFTDLDNEEIRRAFYQEDFRWNQYFNPSVYQALLGITMVEGMPALTTDIEAQAHHVIQMRRIDAQANLTRQLREGRLSLEDFDSMGYQHMKAVDQFPWREQASFPILKQMDTLMTDVERWAWSLDPLFPKALTDRAMQCLRAFIQANQSTFLALTDADMVIGIDNHSDNVFYQEGMVSLIDVYPPKAEWRLVERSYSLFRLAADIEILASREAADAFIQGGVRYYAPESVIRMEMRDFYTLYSALIRAPYLFSLGQTDVNRLEEAYLYQGFIEQALQ